MFAIHNHPTPNISMNNLEATYEEHRPEAGMFQLSVELINTPTNMTVLIGYNSNIFYKETIISFANTYINLIKSCLKKPDTELAKLPLLNHIEKKRLLYQWNSTQKSFHHAKNHVFELVTKQLVHHSKALALVDGATSLTYQTLLERVNATSYHLISKGLKPDDKVAVVLARSVDLIIVMLAVFKSGGIYIPIDCENPATRILLIIQDCNPDLIIVHDGCTIFSSDEKRTITICELNKFKAFTVLPLIERLPQDPAYILYTSGTTGVPKGVIIPHRALTNIVLWRIDQFRINRADRSMVFSSPGFDNFITETWPFLISGASLHIVENHARQNPQALISWLAKNNITFCDLPASYGSLLLSCYWPNFINLRLFIMGAERVTHYPKGNWSFTIWNIYGTTETTVDAIYMQIYPYSHADTPLIEEIPPIGKPLSNMKAYILDKCMQPVPVATIGELYLSGTGVGLGYLNQPTLSKERFLMDPFITNTPVLMYKTGDLARYRCDGNIDYIGRFDNQVKVNGYRIELTEIENYLCQHLSIKSAIVVVNTNDSNNNQLIAFIIKREDRTSTSITTESIRLYLEAYFPKTMIPSPIVFVAQFPRTANDKIDHQALLNNLAKFITTHKTIKPTNDIEQSLQDIWQYVLGTPINDIYADFFNCGGNSIRSLHLLEKINQNFAINLTPTWVFLHRTIHDQAGMLRQNKLTNFKPYITKNVQGTKLPIFFIPPMTGNGQTYAQLIALMDSEQPCFAFETFQLQATYTIESIAKYYLRQIEAIYPHGPYILAGWSFGGIIAYEIAQQLQNLGKMVNLLILFDSHVYDNTVEKPLWTNSNTNLEKNDPVRTTHDALPQSFIDSYKEMNKQESIAMASYKIRAYIGRVILFQAAPSNHITNSTSNNNGFKELISDLILLSTDADHYSLFREKSIINIAEQLIYHLNNKITSSAQTNNRLFVETVIGE